jgi:hypothetical protein
MLTGCNQFATTKVRCHLQCIDLNGKQGAWQLFVAVPEELQTKRNNKIVHCFAVQDFPKKRIMPERNFAAEKRMVKTFSPRGELNVNEDEITVLEEGDRSLLTEERAILPRPYLSAGAIPGKADGIPRSAVLA